MNQTVLPEDTARKTYSGTEQTRAQIVRAAADLFGQRGYEATGIRDIETAAGVSRGVVTYHLGNKETIWKAAFDATFSPFVDQVKASREFLTQLSPSARFRHMVGLFVRASARSPQMVRLMLQEGTGGTWRFDFILSKFMLPFEKESRGIWEGSAFLELFRTNPHLRYAFVGACNMVFAVPAEIDSLFGQDVYTDEFVDTHIDIIVSIFETFGENHHVKPEGA